MYTNIGQKLKGMAKLVLMAGALASLYWGGFLLGAGEGWSRLVGLPAAALGVLASRLVSLVLYGFGELVENSDIRTEVAVRAWKERPEHHGE